MQTKRVKSFFFFLDSDLSQYWHIIALLKGLPARAMGLQKNKDPLFD